MTAGKQAEKSRHTQTKIIEAVMQLMEDGGFAAASSTRIAQAAGVSWGVVQHHFGDKQGILLAVLEQCQAAYIDFMSSTPRSRGRRSKRVADYVQRCWDFYRGREYRISLEIALAMRFKEEHPPASLEPMQNELIELWRRNFSDTDVTDEVLALLIRHTYIVLTGLVIDEMLEGDTSNTRAQMQLLCATIESRLYGT